MSIDISDNLLKSVQQELLVSLRTVEGQIADLLEFGDVQEIDKILDTLHIVEGALMMLSETMAVTVCNDIYNNIKQIAQDTDAYSKQDELLFAFLTLVQSIQLSHLPISQVALKNVHLLLGNDDEVVQDTSLDISTLFPVSEETIETIAFSVKKELSVTKSLVEENFDNLHDKTVKESLSETLAIPFAVFKLLNYQTGVSLIEQARGLLKNNSIKENIEEFTDNIVLLEDALWQLDSLKKQSEKSNQADSKVIQTQHSRNITSQAAKVIFAKTTYLFFKSLREEVIEKFDNLDSLDMMRLGEEFHSIATTAGIFKEHKLAKLLYGSEQRHLFFCQQKEVIKQPKINKIYLDLIVTYEIIFEELQHSKTIDTYALALIEAAQKQLLSQIDFEPEKVATPDYLYASNDDVLADDIEGDLSAISDHSETLNDSSKDTSLTDTDSLDSVSAEVPSPVAQVTDTHSDTEILDSNVEDISESYQDSQPDSQSENEQSADITSHQFTDDNTDEGSKVEEKGQGTVESIYHQLTDAHNLSINTDINSVSEDDIDEEILEIFIEEGQGIADLLKQETPRLKDNYFDEELIKTLQRAYHTLKGSGKMVGLNVFGEFAWQHENLLNHVVSGECQLNEIALQQFIKAQQLVEETVNTEPFVENKDVLLLAAAQAEVIKDLLLGKISMPELNKLDETPTETEPSTDEVTTDTDVSDTDVQETPIAETPAEEVSVEEELSATEEITDVDEPSTDEVVTDTDVVDTDIQETPITETAVEEVSVEEELPVTEEITDIEPSTDEVMTDTDVVDTDVQETPITETAVEEVSVEEELPVTEEITDVDKPSTDKVTTDSDVADTDVQETPISEETVEEVSVEEELPVTEEVADVEPSTDEVTTDSDVVDTDVQETPIAETPAEEVSVEEELSATEEITDVDEPSTDEVVTDTDVTDTDVQETPIAETPAEEVSVEEELSATEEITDVDEPSTDEVVTDTDVVDTDIQETPITETAVEEVSVEEELPVTEEITDVDKPSTDKVTTDSDVADTDVQETPISEETVEEVSVEEELPVTEEVADVEPSTDEVTTDSDVVDTDVQETPIAEIPAEEVLVEEELPVTEDVTDVEPGTDEVKTDTDVAANNISPIIDTGVLSELLTATQASLMSKPRKNPFLQEALSQKAPVDKGKTFIDDIKSDVENIDDLLDELRTTKNRQDTLNDIYQQLDNISKKSNELDYQLGQEMAQRLQESLKAILNLPKDNFPKMLGEYIRSTVKEFTRADSGQSSLEGFQTIIEEMDNYVDSVSKKEAELSQHNLDEQLLEALGSSATTRESIKDILRSLNLSEDEPTQTEFTQAESTEVELASDSQEITQVEQSDVSETVADTSTVAQQDEADALGISAGPTELVGIKKFARNVEPHIQSSKSCFGDWKHSHFTESYYRNSLSHNISDITRLSEQHNMDSAVKLGQSTSGLLSKLAEENIQPGEKIAQSIESAVNEFERLQQAIMSDADSSEQVVRPAVIQEVVSKAVMKPRKLGKPLDFVLSSTDIIAEDNLFSRSTEAVVIDNFQGHEDILPTPITNTIDDVLGSKQSVTENSDYGIRSNNPLDLDETILTIFLEEAQDISRDNQASLDDWKDNYENLTAIQKIQRGMHTLKGGARMAGLTVLGDLSHYVETLLVSIADKLIKDKDNALLLLQEANALSDEMIQLADNNKIIYESPTFIEKLSNFLEAETGKPLDYNQIEKSEELIESKITDYSKKAHHKQNYTLRVKSEVMDKISSLVGEGIINRIRMDRGTAEHNYQLDELSRTITRFREQLRRLETQTEAQILFRHNPEVNTKNNNFDPLELDRFSEIQQLSRQLAESMDDLYSLGRNLRASVDSARQALSTQEKIQRELQDTVVATSVVRFDSIYIRMDALIKQVAKDSQKAIQLEIQGGGIEIERNILEKLIPGFEHAIRNSIVHGIEKPKERRKKGKRAVGRIRLSAHRRGAEIWFTIADDGRGADLDAIRNKADMLGILDKKQVNDKSYLLRLLFKPGFSTANKVTQVFGRGVGLDVLKDVVRDSHGSIEVDTKAGKGMTICIRLPFTMSIADVLPVKIGRYMYAIPIISIEGVIRISEGTYEKFASGEFTHYYYGQYTYKLESLVDFLDPGIEKTLSPHGVPALLVKIGNKRIAFEVGEIGNRQEIIIKSVNKQFTALPGIIGATILDDGQPVPVMEVPTLGRYFFDHKGSSKKRQKSLSNKISSIKKTSRILVVDDSITIRKVSKKILSKYEVEVKTAKDGIDAISVISSWMPDLILLDIEMPRMDGFEFATYIRNTKGYKDIPIIMITSRTGDKHKDQAKTIGVNEYLGKPYVEETLVKTIETVLNKTIEK